MNLFYHRNTCRLCESDQVKLVLKLKDCPPVDAFIRKEQLKEEQLFYPMDLYLCENCGHGQLLDVVSPSILFGSYIYTTESSPGLVEYFRNYADIVYNHIKPPTNSKILDIGSNDGTLLSFFKQKGMSVLGIDPAESIANIATECGIETIPEFFTLEEATKIHDKYGQFSIITANNVFAHSDTLGDMALGINKLLLPDGVFIFEVSYLLDMIKNMVFDFIYHEHLSHHSVMRLKFFILT